MERGPNCLHLKPDSADHTPEREFPLAVTPLSGKSSLSVFSVAFHPKVLLYLHLTSGLEAFSSFLRAMITGLEEPSLKLVRDEAPSEKQSPC